MKRVDRLFIQVKRAYGESDKQVSIGFVDLMKKGEYKGKWRSRADLWDGKPGSQKPEDRIYSYHDTQEDAIKAIQAVAEIHAPQGKRKSFSEDVPIIIMDFI